MNESDQHCEPLVDSLLTKAVEAIGGRERPGQRSMASAIDACIEKKRHLIVQAGTGTGKSVAYLVPALKHSIETDSPVVISTATLALQNQIVTKDLPLLVEALSPQLDRPPSFSLLKGRSHYVCLHKLDGGYLDDIDPASLFSEASVTGVEGDSERLGAQVQRLREWARESDTGDRDDLEIPVSDRAWRQVSVTGTQCLASACPVKDMCFAERNRQIAKDVDVIVTNHALLAIDAFDKRGIIPPHDVVIVDEAHELIDRVTSAVTESLSQGAVRAAVRELRALGVACVALDDAGVQLNDALSPLPAGRIVGELEARLQDTLAALVVEARGAHAEAKEAGDERASTTAGARKSVRTKLQEIIDVCERLLEPAEDDVRYIIHSEHTGRSFIEIAPLTVAGQIRAKILNDHTGIFTSATIAFGDNFEVAAAPFGLWRDNRVSLEEPMSSFLKTHENAEREQWSALDVGSPFNYRGQGILYMAAHLPPPGRDGLSEAALRHIVELIDAAGGGALGLFSSRRAAQQAAEYVRRQTGRTVLLQGEDSNAALAQRFRDAADSCLFGSKTFWQGIDVPGRACRLVIIDRIPFPRPDDPLAAARQERLSRQGGNAFLAVSGHTAALHLAQGAGRLIRAEGDRGMVAVLDSRIVTKSYGGYLRGAMPPLWPTRDAQVALNALERLRALS